MDLTSPVDGSVPVSGRPPAPDLMEDEVAGARNQVWIMLSRCRTRRRPSRRGIGWGVAVRKRGLPWLRAGPGKRGFHGRNSDAEAGLPRVARRCGSGGFHGWGSDAEWGFRGWAATRNRGVSVGRRRRGKRASADQVSTLGTTASEEQERRGNGGLMGQGSNAVRRLEGKQMPEGEGVRGRA